MLNKDLFGKSVPLRILVCLREKSEINYHSIICKEISYSKHLNCYFNSLIKLKLIERDLEFWDKRKLAFKITPLGCEVIDGILSISKKLEEITVKEIL